MFAYTVVHPYDGHAVGDVLSEAPDQVLLDTNCVARVYLGPDSPELESDEHQPVEVADGQDRAEHSEE